MAFSVIMIIEKTLESQNYEDSGTLNVPMRHNAYDSSRTVRSLTLSRIQSITNTVTGTPT